MNPGCHRQEIAFNARLTICELGLEGRIEAIEELLNFMFYLGCEFKLHRMITVILRFAAAVWFSVAVTSVFLRMLP